MSKLPDYGLKRTKAVMWFCELPDGAFFTFLSGHFAGRTCRKWNSVFACEGSSLLSKPDELVVRIKRAQSAADTLLNVRAPVSPQELVGVLRDLYLIAQRRFSGCSVPEVRNALRAADKLLKRYDIQAVPLPDRLPHVFSADRGGKCLHCGLNSRQTVGEKCPLRKY